jgi:hypothetical protein
VQVSKCFSSSHFGWQLTQLRLGHFIGLYRHSFTCFMGILKCLFAPLNCDKCGIYLQRKDLHDHAESCGKVEIQCSSCTEIIFREDQILHMDVSHWTRRKGHDITCLSMDGLFCLNLHPLRWFGQSEIRCKQTYLCCKPWYLLIVKPQPLFWQVTSAIKQKSSRTLMTTWNYAERKKNVNIVEWQYQGI